MSDSQRDPASEGRTAVDKMFDAFIFAPAEALVTAAGDIEGVAERGRQRVAQQLANAKVIGQMAVTFGTQEISRRAKDLISRANGPSAQPSASESDQAAKAPSSEGASARTKTRATETQSARGTVDHLIPGYDDLSASQVVRLLAGLTPEELEEVATHEGASRRRMTILNRIRQLTTVDHEDA